MSTLSSDSGMPVDNLTESIPISHDTWRKLRSMELELL